MGKDVELNEKPQGQCKKPSVWGCVIIWWKVAFSLKIYKKKSLRWTNEITRAKDRQESQDSKIL